jgi:hypothetical protein
VRTACLRSFTALGHTFHLYVYEPFDVPPGVTLKDASEIIPSQTLFYFRDPITGNEDVGPFSDLFRFRLLHLRGGWWADVDTVCLSADIPQVDSAWAREFPEHSTVAIGTALLALPKGSDLGNTLYEECLALSQSSLGNRNSLGPNLLSRTISERGLPADEFGDAHSFFPVRWIEAFKLWLPQFFDEVSVKAGQAQFLTLFQSIARSQGVDVDEAPPSGSYLDQVCQQFGIQSQAVSRQDPGRIVAKAKAYFLQHDWAIDTIREIDGGDATLAALGVG